jgi:hypothetical protein
MIYAVNFYWPPELGIPAFVFTDAVIWDVTNHIFYYVILAAALAGALLVIGNFYRWKVTAYVIGLSIGYLGLTGAMVWAVAHDKLDLGIVFLLAGLNFIVGVLFWRRFQRTTEVLITVFASLPGALNSLLEPRWPPLRPRSTSSPTYGTFPSTSLQLV